MGLVRDRPSKPKVETVAERRLRRLNAFPPTYRKHVAGLTSCAPAVEDLADSFPGLLFALATGYGPVRRRQAAFEAVVAGLPLKAAACRLDLPFWLKRLPAEAFTHPLPALPNDDEFAAIVAGRIPASSRDAAIWFDRAIMAHRIAGRDFTLWCVREPRLLPPHTTDEDMQWLTAWAWATLNPDFRGHRMIRTGWSPEIGWKRARDEISIWRKRIDLVGALAGGPRAPWLGNGSACGYDVVSLDTVDDYVRESGDMENCLDQYAAHLAYGRVRVFSVRKDGSPVADVEITLQPDDPSKPSISQVRGPRNRRAPPSVWQAVHVWISGQIFRPLDIAPTPVQATRKAFRDFWSDYVAAAESAGLPPAILDRVLGRELRAVRSGQPRARNPIETETRTRHACQTSNAETGLASIEIAEIRPSAFAENR
jgi:hypothetical protein